MKKRIWILVALLLVVLLWAAWYFRPVGTIEGPEWDILHVDGVTYITYLGKLLHLDCLCK